MEDEKKQGLESLFVTYEQGLALKELGFDEDCFAFHSTIYGLVIGGASGNSVLYESAGECLAPLKQQVFRWFRDKHNLWFRPDYYDEMREYDYQGSIHQLGRHSSLITLGNCKTVEELEAKCIDELIEMVKNK